MPLSRPRVPLGLLISIAILLILGSIVGPLIRSSFTEKERAANVFLEAIPFILIFVAIILTFITLIVVVASVLNDNIPRRTHRLVEVNGMLNFSANALPLSSVRLASDTTSTPSIFARALTWISPMAPVPARQIFIDMDLSF